MSKTALDDSLDRSLAWAWADSRLHVDLWYPRVTEGRAVREVQVGLMDVRAADDIRISYDFDRDGWVIKQQPELDEDAEDEAPWIEVAFVQAWGAGKQTPISGGSGK